ncbi:MAG: Formate dehydrogenase O beta subunit, partial [uncultured Rubrobacteraceae bacterium]
GYGISDRHNGLHRLQGLRGRLQAVEPAPRRRLRVYRRLLRQHKATLRHDLAPRRVYREPQEEAPHRRHRPRGARRGRDRAAPQRGRARRSRALGVHERRVQALRRRALPAGVPDGFDHPQRVRQRLYPAGHLQRLWLLRPGLPLRRHNPGPPRRPRLQVHPLLRPPGRRPRTGVRQGLPDELHPVRRRRGPESDGRGARTGAPRQGLHPGLRLGDARGRGDRRHRRQPLQVYPHGRARDLQPAQAPVPAAGEGKGRRGRGRYRGRRPRGCGRPGVQGL